MNDRASIYEEKRQKVENNIQCLAELETELAFLIGETGNEKLKSKFLEWQSQRNECNKDTIEMFRSVSVPKLTGII